MRGPTKVSLTTPSPAFVRPSGVLPLLERISVLEPAAGEHGSAYEVGQAADAPKVSAYDDVVLGAAQLARAVCTQPERGAQCELIRRQRHGIEGRADRSGSRRAS